MESKLVISCSIMHTLIKIYHVVQEVFAFSLSDHGRTDSHSDYSAHLRVVQYCLAFKQNHAIQAQLRALTGIYWNNLYRLGLFQNELWGGSRILRQSLVAVLHASSQTKLKCISKQN